MDEETPTVLSIKNFSANRGFTTQQMHDAAEELRMNGQGSEDPYYENSTKNK